MVPLEQLEHAGGLRAPQLGVGGAGEVEGPALVRVTGGPHRAGLVELGQGVGLHRLQEAVAGRGGRIDRRLDRHERRAHQPVQRTLGRRRHRDHPVRAEGPRERGQRREQLLLGGGEEPEAPVDDGPERLLPGRGRAPAAGEQLEAILQAGDQLVHRELARGSGRELDGQRDAVELGHHRRRGPGRALVQREPRLHQLHALDEQLHGLARGELDDRVERVGRRHAQRGQAPDGLALDPQRLSARGQDRHVRAGPCDALDQLGGSVDHVLAVVEEQERLLHPQRREDGVDERLALLLRDGQRVGQRPHHARLVGDRREVGQEHAVGVAGEQAPAELDGEAGLADAPRAQQRDDAGAVEQAGHLGLVFDAPDEGRAGLRQVARQEAERPHGREEHGPARLLHLVEAHGAGEVADLVQAEIGRPQPVRQPATRGERTHRRLGHHQLAAVRGVGDARGLVHGDRPRSHARPAAPHRCAHPCAPVAARPRATGGS